MPEYFTVDNKSADDWYRDQLERTGVSYYETVEQQQELAQNNVTAVYFPPGKKTWFHRWYDAMLSKGFTTTEVNSIIEHDEYAQELVWGSGWREWEGDPLSAAEYVSGKYKMTPQEEEVETDYLTEDEGYDEGTGDSGYKGRHRA